MLSSNIKHLILVSLLAVGVSIGLSGCLNPDKKSGEDVEQSGQGAQASFYVKSMETPQAQPPRYDSIWALPSASNYKFKACLISRVTRESIIARKFTVLGGTGNQHVVSDGSGCIEWSEQIPFNFFADQPKYLIFERVIRGEGIDRGEQKIEFALDPWKATRGGDHAEFIFLRKPDLVEEQVSIRGSQAVFQAQNASIPHKLLVGSLAVDIQQRKQLRNGIELSMALEMSPSVRLQRMDGSLDEFKFNRGRFSVYAQIIATNLGPNQDQNYLMTPHLVRQSVNMEDGELRLTFPSFPLTVYSTDGNLVLAVKVIPEGQSAGLKEFTATYRLGSFDQWLGSKKPLRQEDNIQLGMTYDQLIKTAVTPEAAFAKNNDPKTPMKEKIGNLAPLEPFSFSYLLIKYNGIKAGETATTRTVAFDVKVCITNTFRGGIKAAFKKFKIIRRPGQKPIEKDTDEHGCFAWIDEVTHKYYRPEYYMVSPVLITDIASGFTKELKIAINPWDLFATFGKDLREVESSDIRFQTENLTQPYQKIESRFNLANFRYTAILFDYEVDQDLSLNVKKSVLMELHPEVQRYSSITGGRLAVERLRDGIWLLKAAIQKDYLDPATKDAIIDKDSNGRPVYRLNANKDIREKQFVSFQEKLVRVINGRIITPIEFEMRDLRLMRIRSNMLIQLQPIDETKLQFANIYREHLDKVSKIRERMEGTLSDLERDRSAIAPDPKAREAVDTSSMNRDERAQTEEEMSIVERRRYYEDRMMMIDNLVKNLNSNQLREAFNQSEEDALDKINDLISEASRFDEKGFPLESKSDGSIFRSTVNPILDAELLSSASKQLELTRDQLSRLRLNDFTVEPTAPTMSLEFLIEDYETSGLRRRTFVGPITFLYNSNSSEVRPTDTLDEVFCLNNTCDSSTLTDQQLKEWNWDTEKPYAWRRFYGWVAHFFNKHVDDLIFEQKGGVRTVVNSAGQSVTENIMGMEEIDQREIKARSLLSNFVNANDLTYVSLRDVPLKTVAKTCEVPFYDESCLVVTDESTLRFNDFLDEVNSIGTATFQPYPNQIFPDIKINPAKPTNAQEAFERTPRLSDSILDYNYYAATTHLPNYPITKEEVKDFIKSEKAANFFAEKLCHVMSNKLMRRLVDIGYVHVGLGGVIRREITNTCIRQHVEESNEVLTVESRYKVGSTGRVRFKGGKSLNINVNQSFQLSNKVSAGFKMSYDFLGLPRMIPVIGNALAGGGIQVGRDVSRDRSVGTSIVEGAFLVVQMANFDIELTSYEKCLVLGYKHDTLARILTRHGNLNRDVNPADVAMALDSGFLICTGEIENKPLPVRERYYYVTQHFTEGDMLDSGDLFNHPWLLAIRGARDFKTFMLALHDESDAQKVSMLDAVGATLSGDAEKQSRVQRYTWPLERLVKTYLYVRPSFPGLYSDVGQEPMDFHWDESPGDGFSEAGSGLGPPTSEFITDIPAELVN